MGCLLFIIGVAAMVAGSVGQVPAVTDAGYVLMVGGMGLFVLEIFQEAG